ncbi:hypothetical protein GOZ78_12480 [Agrobacterium vitis]|uniref:Uncharacterized protein n=2 Tax=Agrobacterium vitis TaxID=373 RepID=A0ABD6GH88_AGRVI|nr:hypothetical protein [Agrobacterium vitis]MUO80913.1 hypothetical protein [Agrobacterium vitis]MUO97408.1 hypothetical protein [Agrobacterium vitis]MUP06560.1 hypothetical protein [Agrobacterium vitis]MUZ84164.1 hypothetical protein [Agrobacterium vitis]MVA10845.1 hypothetical protein [Agrobacterium vitis]
MLGEAIGPKSVERFSGKPMLGEAIGPKSVERFSDKPMLGEVVGLKSVKLLMARAIIPKNNPSKNALLLFFCQVDSSWLGCLKNIHRISPWTKTGSFWSVADLGC